MPREMSEATSGTRGRSVSGSALTIGSILNGLFAYVFFATVTRSLGAADAAPVSVLWAFWSFAGAAFTFPIQHWVARTVTAHAGERAVRDALGGIAAVTVAAATLVGLAGWLFSEQLFGPGHPEFAAMAAGVTLGATAMGFFRGVLSARSRFAAVGVGLAAENAVRVVGAGVLMVAGVTEPAAYGLCLLLGYVAALGFPSAFRLTRDGTPAAESALAFLTGTSGGQLLAQTVLTGGPVLLAVLGGAPAQVTGLFAALALFRAPYTLSLGLVSPLTGHLTGLLTRGDSGAWRRIRTGILGLTGAGLVLALLVGWTIGPWTIRLVFGGDVEVTRTVATVIAVGSAAALANLLVSIMVLAHGRAALLARCWVLALVPGIAWVVVALALDVDPTTVTAWAFTVVEAAALLSLGVAERRTPVPALSPGAAR